MQKSRPPNNNRNRPARGFFFHKKIFEKYSLKYLDSTKQPAIFESSNKVNNQKHKNDQNYV